MAEEILGLGFDIHGGGNDLVFPHHENEAAQTRMARGQELAQIWMHNGMLQLDGEKMAKSVGNIESLATVLERWGRDALVLFFVSGHYRQPLLFSDQSLEQAQTSARRIRAAKDWEQADLLRDQLAALGWEVRDGDDGAKLVAL